MPGTSSTPLLKYQAKIREIALWYSQKKQYYDQIYNSNLCSSAEYSEYIYKLNEEQDRRKVNAELAYNMGRDNTETPQPSNPNNQSVDVDLRRFEVRRFYEEFQSIGRSLDSTQLRHRKPNIPSKKHQSIKRGTYLSHDIPFSAEIECYGKSKEDVIEVSSIIHKDIGLCHDGSLTSGLGFPIEIQTPILKGKKGEICIAELCTTLINKGFKVDKTCGLHIHLDGKEIGIRSSFVKAGGRPEVLIRLYLAYRLFDPVLLSMLPSTRRKNQYCLSFDDVSNRERTVIFDSFRGSLAKMKNVNSIIDFEHYWYKTGGNYEYVNQAKSTHYTWARYFGINFHSLLKDNHLEIRYHSGTLNYEKILYWIDLHGKIIEKCINGEITVEMLENLHLEKLTIIDLTKRMFKLLKLKEETVEYLQERQSKFKDAVATEEILINKTKKVATF